MPGMDGMDLTKAVKHLRPDIDVVMITGYGTIESAVSTMRFGAMDYVEKPFTPDELGAFTNKCLIRRRDRIEKEIAPRVQLVTAAVEESHSPNVINVPGGIYVSPEHTWVGIDITGEARIGLDDFALKSLEDIKDIEFPAQGSQVRKGEPLFSLRRGETLPDLPLAAHRQGHRRQSRSHLLPGAGYPAAVRPGVDLLRGAHQAQPGAR